jgi:hydrogenase expression/formation protein HypC
MCLGIAGQIIELLAEPRDVARTNVFGAERLINIGMLQQEELKAGDWVLIHVGFAIAKMTAAEAQASQSFLQAMGAAHTDAFGFPSETPFNDAAADPRSSSKGNDPL